MQLARQHRLDSGSSEALSRVPALRVVDAGKPETVPQVQADDREKSRLYAYDLHTSMLLRVLLAMSGPLEKSR